MAALSETIDLCESDEELAVKDSNQNKVGDINVDENVEIITLDDTGLSETVPNESVSPSSLASQTSKLSLRSTEEGEIQSSEDEIQILREMKPAVPVKRKSKKFALPHDPYAFFALDRRPSGPGKRDHTKFGVNPFSKPQGGICKKRNKKKKGKNQQKFIPTNNHSSEVSTAAGRKALNRIKNEARRQAIRELVPTTTPRARPQLSQKIQNNRRDKHVPIMQDGVPKFRLKPVFGHGDPQNSVPGLGPFARTVECQPQPSSSDGAASTSDPLDHFRITVNNAATSAATVTSASATATTDQIPAETGKRVSESAEVQIEAISTHVTNAYNSGPVEQRRKGDLRPIVIDASNVAFGHGNGHVYSCQGIKICCDYFRGRGHKVYAFMPSYRKKSSKAKDVFVLHELEKQGIAKFTPSREVAGEHIVSYDDRFILQFANDSGGIVVSNDNYRDLYNEQPQWRDTIRNRLLPYTWISDTYIMFPPDPLGPTGPNLDDFLRF